MAVIARTNVVIPEQYIEDIITATTASSAVMKLARKVQMSYGSAKQPVLGLLPIAGFVSPRDTGLKAMASASWDGIELTAEEIATIVPIPENVLDDATFDIFGTLQPAIAEALGAVIDGACLFGTNAPVTWPTGGIAAMATAAANDRTEASVAGQDLAEDLNAIMGMVEDDGFDVDGFVIRRTLKRSLRGLRDSNNRPIFSPGLAGSIDELYSEPVTYTSLGWQGAAPVAFAGDWDMAVVGMRRDMTFKILDQAVIQNPDGTIAYNLPQQDMVALRCVMRLGFALAKPASAQSETAVAANRAPFAILNPAI